MGDWEDFCDSNGKGMDWEPWNESGWADDDYNEIDNTEEFEVDNCQLNTSIAILRNLLERANANDKHFTNMEREAIKFAISILSKQDEFVTGSETGAACPEINTEAHSKEHPMDFEDDIPF